MNMIEIDMLFVRRIDMSNIVPQTNKTEMKKSTLLVVAAIVLLTVGSFFYFRSGTEVESTRFTEQNTNVDSDIEEQKPLNAYGKLDDSCDVKGINGGGELVSGSQVANLAQGDTINLRDFGVIGNGKNETVGFQKALNAAVGKVLFIPKQKGSYYLTRQLLIPSNSTLVFESGTIVQATDNLKQSHANFEALFRIQNADNVIIKGNSALLRMNKSAYKGEHNHIFMINGSSNVTINNVKANNSGGDGFYIGAYKTKRRFSENIKIRNVSADNNRRQGISVISARNLIVEDCEFSNSNGALPEAGVDVEPSLPSDIIEQVRFINCIAKGNNAWGFCVALIKADNTSKPVDIIFENCKAIDNKVGFTNRYFSEASSGLVRFIDCVAENSHEAGFWEVACAASGAAKEYNRCITINSNIGSTATDMYRQYAGFRISNLKSRTKKVLGNSTFTDCRAIKSSKNSRMDYGISTLDKASYQKVRISNFVSQGHDKKDINLGVKDFVSKEGISVIR
ncbi:right-handed parallel beta-helix repeat-containing protein [Sphingobacterium phlebotomi]|nr:right-handed parallel beta-helix repeat-containing protein [Sphingobacterium phlebotomi]